LRWLPAFPRRQLRRAALPVVPGSHIPRLVLGGVVLATLFAGPRQPPPAVLPAAGPGHLSTLLTAPGTCPLSPGEETEAVQQFDRLWPVIRHPRCLNCHGAVNPLIDEKRGHHGGGKVVASIEKCQECHTLKGWDTPVSAFFFTGRSARQLCMQFKAIELDPTAFVKHIYNDRGGTPFTVVAFKGDRALDDAAKDMVADATGRPFVEDPPPMSHGEFLQLASDWANMVGERGWKATPDCGCGRKKSAWTGTITAVWDHHLGELGDGTEKTTANVRFELDTSYAPGPDVYWSTTSGEIDWSIEIHGKCHASASKTIAIGLGGDDNPLGVLSDQQMPGGRRFFVGNGPWRDADVPQYMIRCPEGQKLYGPLFGGGVWWLTAPSGITSPDGKTLKGSYTMATPGGTGVWTWDLQLDK